MATPASAAIFATGSTLNVIGDFRAPDDSEGEEAGVRVSNRLLFGPESSGSSAFAEVGEFADTTIGGASNSGDFAGYNVPNPGLVLTRYEGQIKSFGPSTFSSTVPVLEFIVLPSTAAPDSPFVPNSTFQLEKFRVSSISETAFAANGSGFFLSEGDRTPGTFEFTGQGLTSANNDFRGTYSATLTATPVTVVPEPTSTLGLLAFGALGGGTWLKKRKQKVAA